MKFLKNKKNSLLLIFLLLFVWRIFLFLPLFASNQLLQERKGYEYTLLSHYNDSSSKIVNNFLVSPWANFDGVAYLGIAGNGYSSGNARFFPLYPMLIKSISILFGNPSAFGLGQFLIAFILSNCFFLASLFIFYKIIRLDFSKTTALLSLVALLVFPTSFFFGSVYTESLFLLLSLLSFYFARKKLWILAAITGLLLSATRIVGIVIFPVLLWEFFTSHHLRPSSRHPELDSGSSNLVRKIPDLVRNDIWNFISLLFAPLGLLAFIWFNAHTWNDSFYFLHQQGALANGRSVSSAVFIPQTMYRYIKILITVSPLTHFEWWISFLEFCSFLFTGIMLFVAYKKKLRLSYILFAVLCFLIPAASGTFSGLPRYVVILFPMFIAIGLIKNKFFWITYISISIILLFLCIMYFSKGYFIA